jgi:hypothetical protein
MYHMYTINDTFSKRKSEKAKYPEDNIIALTIEELWVERLAEIEGIESDN